jgi:hypothetical protein
MKFNLLRFLFLLILPVVIIGVIVFGVAIKEHYEERGEFFTPANPVAHESAKFSYQLINPSTKEPLHNASVHLEIAKTGALNHWLDVGYLRQDNQGTGLVYQMDSFLNDGKIEMESILWDAGAYMVSIHATSPELQKPVDIKVPVDVKVPLGQIIRTIILFVGIFLAATVSGYIAGQLENPFKKNNSKLRGTVQSTLLLLLACVVLSNSIAPIALAHGNEASSHPNEPMKIEKSGVRAELNINPMEPVQKGKPAHFALTFHDSKTGQPIQGMDASLSLYHEDDNLTMFTTRTELPDGKFVFDYAFPDTAKYQLIIHAAPNSPKSTLLEPFDGKLSFEVPPVQPSVAAQIRAGILMFIVLVAGFAIGVMGTRRKKSVSFA